MEATLIMLVMYLVTFEEKGIAQSSHCNDCILAIIYLIK